MKVLQTKPFRFYKLSEDALIGHRGEALGAQEVEKQKGNVTEASKVQDGEFRAGLHFAER